MSDERDVGRRSDERVWGSFDNGRPPFPVALSGTPSGCSFQPWSCGGCTRRAGDWAGLEGD